MTSNVAVVGMGYWGRNLVRNFFELGALAAICDSNAALREEVQTKYPGVAFVHDLEEVLRDPRIAAVAVVTPAVTHFDVVRRALRAGKDVFVEKPLATELAHGIELEGLAAAEKRVLMVGHILRYHPGVRRLIDLVRGGALGQIRYVYSNRLNIGKIRREENILWSFAPHDISVMLALLNETPHRISSRGSAHLSKGVFDVTVSQFDFPSGVQAHVFVSWLHPLKEQRLVVVGSEQMAVFDDTARDKLVLYPHRVEWKDHVPTAVKADGRVVAIEAAEPLKEECRHFLECLSTRQRPLTDAAEGMNVLRVLDACERSIREDGAVVSTVASASVYPRDYFQHESAFVDEGAVVGAGTKIWHFGHVMSGARIGERCILGQNVNIGPDTRIGNNVKIQNNVSVYAGTVIEDDVFLGPSCVLTNVSNPRSEVNRHELFEQTVLRRGCTIGANATIVCGKTVGRFAFVAAGAVVSRDIADYALVAGVPARQVGWMSRLGHKLADPDAAGIMRCPESGHRYQETAPGVLRCLDLAEDAPLPQELRAGKVSYRDVRRE